MRTEYKRGKPLDLQVPAVRMQTREQDTFIKMISPQTLTNKTSVFM